MRTYQVTCKSCGEERWPMLHERPIAYICARCSSVTTAQREARQAQGQKAAQTKKARQNTSGDAT